MNETYIQDGRQITLGGEDVCACASRDMAARVARVLNSHDELVAALERIADEDQLEAEYDGEEFEVVFKAAQEIARAALAKARG